MMKAPFYLVLAASLALSQVAISTASAETAATHFRSAPAQTFSQADLQRYGLSSEQAARGAELQRQGYQVQVMTQEEAQRVHGGQISYNTWIIIGVVALIVIAVAVSNN
jgi:Spy/CpxP family protein refolding chaperone